MLITIRLNVTQSVFLLFIFVYANLIQAQIISPSIRSTKAMVLISEEPITMGSELFA